MCVFTIDVVIHLLLKDDFGWEPSWSTRHIADKDLKQKMKDEYTNMEQRITSLLRPGGGQSGISYEMPDQSVSNSILHKTVVTSVKLVASLSLMIKTFIFHP